MFTRWARVRLVGEGRQGWSLEVDKIGGQTAQLSLVRRGAGGPRRFSVAYLITDRAGRKDAFAALRLMAQRVAA